MKKILYINLFLMFALATIISCSGGSQSEIVIGNYGSLTGTTATFGISCKNGIEMATEKVNARGGILSKPLKVIYEDTQGKAEEAAAVVQKLINQDDVAAVIGEIASSRSLAGAPICQRAMIPMITPASTNPEVTKKGDYIFRVCYMDDFQGEVIARIAAEMLKVKTAAVLQDVKNDYSVGLAEFFTKEFEKRGGTVLVNESYSEGDIDFRAQLTSIKNKNPQVLMVPGYYTEVGLVARQARELGITFPIVGGDGWDSPRLIDIGREALEGAYFVTHFTDGDPDSLVQNFVKEYEAKYHEKPDAMAVLGYDAAMILYQAIRNAGSTGGPALRDAIAATSGFKGVTGMITIDENRNANKPAVVVKVNGGKLQFVQWMYPQSGSQSAEPVATKP
ncbi:MAG: ABC transporter substrate-binding protein [candidate division Zixibacteria bacterium]|nr:ABC transporter substrate-binding protein [candidate division Zixibacteria bacterium]